MCGNRAGRSTTTTATMGSPVRPSCTQENQTDAVLEDAQSEYATSNGSLCKEEPSIMQPQIIGCYIMMRQQKLPVYYVDERTVVMMI